MIPQGEKFDDFGLHAHKYYKVEHSFFKSAHDTMILERLWNEFWVQSLSSSPLLSNQDIISKSIINIERKLTSITSGQNKGKRGGWYVGDKHVLDEKFAPV